MELSRTFKNKVVTVSGATSSSSTHTANARVSILENILDCRDRLLNFACDNIKLDQVEACALKRLRDSAGLIAVAGQSPHAVPPLQTKGYADP
jgi:hypothetical protein